MKNKRFIDYKITSFNKNKMSNDKMFKVHLKNVSRVCLGLLGFIFFDDEYFVTNPGLE